MIYIGISVLLEKVASYPLIRGLPVPSHSAGKFLEILIKLMFLQM